jgi:branched-chain amino acid transport system permease protein
MKHPGLRALYAGTDSSHQRLGGMPTRVPPGQRAVPYGVYVAVVAVIIELTCRGNVLYNWSLVGVEVLFALGAAIALGWAGLPAFGQGLFFAFGAYLTGMLRNINVPPEVLLIMGGLAGGVVAVIFAVVTLRLPFITFAMWSLIAAQVVYQVLFSVNTFGAENGLYGIPRGDLFGASLTSNSSWYWYVAVIVVLATMGARWLYNSSFGYAVRACRDDKVRAEASGVRVFRTQVIAFGIAGIACGAAGVLYAQGEGVVDPSVAFWTTSAVAIIMVLIGGLRRFFGFAVGAIIYEWLNLEVTSGSSSPELWLGVIVVIIVILAPQGLLELSRRGYLATVRGVRRRRAGQASPPQDPGPPEATALTDDSGQEELP